MGTPLMGESCGASVVSPILQGLSAQARQRQAVPEPMDAGEFQDAAEHLAVDAVASHDMQAPAASHDACHVSSQDVHELAAAYQQFAGAFEQLDGDGDGFISGAEARPVLLQSGLSTADLRLIWDLADVGKDGRLDQHEFVLAMLLIQRRQQGQSLPTALPAVLCSPPSQSETSFKSQSMLPVSVDPAYDSPAVQPLSVDTAHAPDTLEQHAMPLPHTLLPQPIDTDSGSSPAVPVGGMGVEPKIGPKKSLEPKKSPTLSQMMADSLMQANMDLEKYGSRNMDVETAGTSSAAGEHA